MFEDEKVGVKIDGRYFAMLYTKAAKSRCVSGKS
jgi:hypothetical protein